MKTYCRGLVIDENFVRQAYEKWTKSKSGKKNGWKIARDFGTPDNLIAEIVAEITDRNLHADPIRHDPRLDPMSGKVRDVGIQSVKQQVLDYVAVECIRPMLSRLGHWQCASIPGRGQVYARNALAKWVRESRYFVKLDIRHCYPDADTDCIYHEVIASHIDNESVLYLCRFLLGTYHGGLNIGSFFSLQLANLSMSHLYHYMETASKVRRGKRKPLITHQLYYMDDIMLMSGSKRDLKCAARMVEAYMRDTFHWQVKPWKICRCDKEPLDMCGYVMRPEKVTIRACIFKRAKRALNRMWRAPCLKRAQRVISYNGFFIHSDSQRFMTNYLDALRAARQLVREKG